jgi:ferredoxin
MSKVTVNDSLCTGCGLCEGSCPEIFKVMQDNVARVIAQDCKSHDLKQIASECPVEAIIIR